MSPRIYSGESIPPAYEDCRAGTTTLFLLAPHRLFKNSSTETNGDKLNAIKYDEEIFCIGPTRAAKEGQNLLYRHDKPKRPSKEGPLSLILLESPFASVLTVSRGHPSLVSLVETPHSRITHT
jgi:hypothetical protein